jgi:integrase
MENGKLNRSVVDDAELQKFLEALEEDGNEKMKLFSLISLMTGLRANQILPLKFDEMDEKASTISLILDKSSSDKQSKINVAITPLVLSLIKKEKELNPTDIYIFQSKKSNNVSNQTTKPLSRQAINFAFSKANKSAGSSITPSKMRQICIEKFYISVESQAGHFLKKKY